MSKKMRTRRLKKPCRLEVWDLSVNGIGESGHMDGFVAHIEDPMVEFESWFQQALACDNFEPTAMVLSSVDREGMPSSRMVLLKVFDSRGFCFFTNYHSTKAREMMDHPRACLCFHWQKPVHTAGEGAGDCGENGDQRVGGLFQDPFAWQSGGGLGFPPKPGDPGSQGTGRTGQRGGISLFPVFLFPVPPTGEGFDSSH